MPDIDILNELVAGEHYGIAAYEAAIGSGLLDEPTANVARAFQSDHVKHRDVLSEQITARGGMAAEASSPEEYAMSYPPLMSAADIVGFAIQLESAAARSHVGSVPEFEDRSLALLSAEIGAVEAQHWATLLGATGANPVPSPLLDPKGGDMGGSGDPNPYGRVA